LRDLYVRTEEEFTKLHLIDTQILMAYRAARLIQQKAFRLKLAVFVLGLTIPLTSVDALVR